MYTSYMPHNAVLIEEIYDLLTLILKLEVSALIWLVMRVISYLKYSATMFDTRVYDRSFLRCFETKVKYVLAGTIIIKSDRVDID